jgi:hypothetical protein
MALIAIRPGLLRDAAADLRQGGKNRLAVEPPRGGVGWWWEKITRRPHGALNPELN